MNITALFSLYILNSQSQYVAGDINLEISQSLRYVIDNFFMKYSTSFVYILWCDRTHTLNFFKDLMEVLFSYWDTMKVQISMNDMDGGSIRPSERNFNLIMVDSAESFLKINPASKVKNYDINEYYYVFIQNRDKYLLKDIQTVLDYCWTHYIINVNILVQKASGDLIIYTYFPFTAAHCRKVVPVEINRYRNGTMDNADIFPEKLLNMHHCPVRAALWDVPPFVSLDKQKTGRDAIGGFEGKLLKALSDLMNFRIDYIVPPNNERKGIIIGNRTTGAIRMIQRKEADLSMGIFQFTIDRARTLTPSDTYYQIRQIVLVLRESPNYVSPEMLFYPFSPFIWVLLFTTFTLVLGILIGANFYARGMAARITKPSEGNICIRFIAITLGMPAALCPRSHFGRFFMTTWMLSTMVIRSEYQALIYHLIRNNFFKVPPRTIEELVRQDYTFVINEYAYEAMRSVSLLREVNLEIQKPDAVNDGAGFAYLESNPGRKLAAVSANEFFLHYGAKNRKAGVFITLREAILAHNINIYFTKHSFLVNRVNVLVRWMNAFGLISSWASKALDLSYFMVPLEAKQTTIGQDELRGVYYLCGLLLILSSFIFVLELISIRCQALGRALKKML